MHEPGDIEPWVVNGASSDRDFSLCPAECIVMSSIATIAQLGLNGEVRLDFPCGVGVRTHGAQRSDEPTAAVHLVFPPTQGKISLVQHEITCVLTRVVSE